MLEILQELYDPGIDVSIACMTGAGFLVELGMDGAMIDATHVCSYAEASEWLKKAAIRHYPAFHLWPQVWWFDKDTHVVEANAAAALGFVDSIHVVERFLDCGVSSPIGPSTPLQPLLRRPFRRSLLEDSLLISQHASDKLPRRTWRLSPRSGNDNSAVGFVLGREMAKRLGSELGGVLRPAATDFDFDQSTFNRYL